MPQRSLLKLKLLKNNNYTKLLSPQGNVDGRAVELTRDALRIAELKKAEDKQRLALARAEVDFKATLARNLKAWEAYEQEFEERKKEMAKEIAVLEAKKLNALIPIGILKKGADDRMLEAEKFLAELKQREEHNEDLAERLQDKLDAVGQREQDNKKEKQRLTGIVEGIEKQKITTSLNAKKLSSEMTEFYKMKEQTEKDIAERKTAIFLIEQSQMAKEEGFKRKSIAFEELGKKLEDERALLDRAWQELNRKK